MKAIIKKFIPLIVFELYHWYKMTPTEKKEKKEILRIKKIPRFIEGFTDIFNQTNQLKYIDSASFLFIYDEIFKKEIYKFKSSTDKPFIIDAGANIGLSAIYLKKLFPKASIVAFEPDPAVFTILKHNIESFNFENVNLVNKALWNEETQLNFFSEGADGGRMASAEDASNIIKIETTKLSYYLKDTVVDFLKIDIEGAEFTVLQEAKPFLKNVKNIFVEFHSFTNRQQNLAALISILEEAGFRIIVQHIGVYSTSPFHKIETYNGMDLQLNIYGIRV